MVGEKCMVFENCPTHSLEASSYCTIAFNKFERFNEMFLCFPEMKKKMQDFITRNPYDRDREAVVNLIDNNIDFLQGLGKNQLRQMYYRAPIGLYDSGEKLFDIHDTCDTIYIILSGVIDIVISDGINIKGVMDVLGPGSIIGINTFLKNEKWYYYAINNVRHTCKVLKITWKLLNIMILQNAKLKKKIEAA